MFGINKESSSSENKKMKALQFCTFPYILTIILKLTLPSLLKGENALVCMTNNRNHALEDKENCSKKHRIKNKNSQKPDDLDFEVNWKGKARLMTANDSKMYPKYTGFIVPLVEIRRFTKHIETSNVLVQMG